jgi:hypothetical protein
MNYKGKCERCGDKCSVTVYFCDECLKFLKKNVAWGQCSFSYSDGRQAL